MSTLIENQISHSIKIAKQVLLTKYTKEGFIAEAAYNAEKTRLNFCRGQIFGGISESLGDKAIAAFSDTEDYKAIKALVELNGLVFSIEEFSKNDTWHLFADTNYCHLLDPRDSGFDINGPTGVLKEALATKVFSIAIECKVRCKTVELRMETKVHIDVPFTEEQLVILQSTLDIYTEYDAKLSEFAKSKTDIAGIDIHMEKIEAQLLLKELSSTEAGKDVLALTQSILSADTDTELPKLMG